MVSNNTNTNTVLPLLKPPTSKWDYMFNQLVTYKARHGNNNRSGSSFVTSTSLPRNNNCRCNHYNNNNNNNHDYKENDSHNHHIDNNNNNNNNSNNKQLLKWVIKQRKNFKKNKLSIDRIVRLKSIGFIFNDTAMNTSTRSVTEISTKNGRGGQEEELQVVVVSERDNSIKKRGGLHNFQKKFEHDLYDRLLMYY